MNLGDCFHKITVLLVFEKKNEKQNKKRDKQKAEIFIASDILTAPISPRVHSLASLLGTPDYKVVRHVRYSFNTSAGQDNPWAKK